MSDFENEDTGDSLGSLVAEMTGTEGLPDDVGPDDAMPSHIAGQVEEYDANAAQRDAHLAEDGEGEQVDEQVEQVEQQPQGGKQRVPLAALQEERRARQAAQEQLRVLQEQLAAHQAQVQQFQALQAQLQQAQRQAQIPAFEDDPEGHMNARLQQIEQAQLQQQQAAVQRQQLEQAAFQVQQEMAQLAPQVTAVEQEFRQQHGDYDAAFAHLVQIADAHIAQQYPGVAPEIHQAAKQMALVQFLRACEATGENPAQLIYNKARALGYQTQHRAPAPMKRAPTSLSNLPAAGRAPDERGALSASQVASMSNEEFDRLFEQMRAADAPRFGF